MISFRLQRYYKNFKYASSYKKKCKFSSFYLKISEKRLCTFGPPYKKAGSHRRYVRTFVLIPKPFSKINSIKFNFLAKSLVYVKLLLYLCSRKGFDTKI